MPPLLALTIFLGGLPSAAQTENSVPYASIDKGAITYAGPGREASHDFKEADIVLGMLLPLEGPRQAEGRALLEAARMAIDDEAATPLPGGRRLVLQARDESGPWGRASAEIVRLVTEERAVALLTSADGGSAHLAEQVGNRLGVPVLTLASDVTTTQINIPWVFRVPPSDAVQAEAMVEDIYRRRRLRKVLLVTEDNHDGRVGINAFQKAVHRIGAPDPTLFSVDFASGNSGPYLDAIRGAGSEALVLWTGSQAAARILAKIGSGSGGVYLCQKAAQAPVTRPEAESRREGVWVASARRNEALDRLEDFRRRYKERTGDFPSPVVLAAYDSVRLVAAALRKSGPNRARLRDALATPGLYPGIGGAISFDGAGNNRTAVTLVQFP